MLYIAKTMWTPDQSQPYLIFSIQWSVRLPFHLKGVHRCVGHHLQVQVERGSDHCWPGSVAQASSRVRQCKVQDSSVGSRGEGSRHAAEEECRCLFSTTVAVVWGACSSACGFQAHHHSSRYQSTITNSIINCPKLKDTMPVDHSSCAQLKTFWLKSWKIMPLKEWEPC